MLPSSNVTEVAMTLPLGKSLTVHERQRLRLCWGQHSDEAREVVQDFLYCSQFEELIQMYQWYRTSLPPVSFKQVCLLLPRRLLVWLESHDDLFEWYFMLVKAGLEDWNGLVNESFVN